MKSLFNARNLCIALLLITLTFMETSCKKSNSSSSSSSVSVDDAADAVTQAVSPTSAGMVSQTETAAVVANGSVSNTSVTGTTDNSCNLATDTTFAGASLSGAAITYSYSYTATRLLTCSTGIPQSFSYDLTGKWSYNAPRISSNDSANAQFVITGLPYDSTAFIFNGTYVRNGSETSNIGNKASFTSTITLDITNLRIDKSTDVILSGTANVTISGADSGGNSFSYSGTVTFLGGGQATLVLGNGNTYSISWS